MLAAIIREAAEEPGAKKKKADEKTVELMQLRGGKLQDKYSEKINTICSGRSNNQ